MFVTLIFESSWIWPPTVKRISNSDSATPKSRLSFFFRFLKVLSYFDFQMTLTMISCLKNKWSGIELYFCACEIKTKLGWLGHFVRREEERQERIVGNYTHGIKTKEVTPNRSGTAHLKKLKKTRSTWIQLGDSKRQCELEKIPVSQKHMDRTFYVGMFCTIFQ